MFWGNNTPADVVGYTDSNFAGSKTNRKSTGGYIFNLTGAPISHSSKLQSILALSTCKAEYVAMCKAGKEAVWLSYLLSEMGYHQQRSPVLLYVDNQGAIQLAKNPKFHRRTKHISLWYHWICEAIEYCCIHVVYIPTGEMAANGFTKPLPAPAFEAFL